MDYTKEYQQKLMTPAEAVKLVKDGDWVDYSQTCSFPIALDNALGDRAGENTHVKTQDLGKKGLLW